MTNSLKTTDKVLEGEIITQDSRVKYSNEYPERVKELCLLGLTNKQIACSIDISLSQLETWREEHEELREAFIDGRDRADGKVALSLYHRALGVSVTEVKTQGKGKEKVVITTVKELPPDVSAASLILRNHQSGKFKDTKEFTGKITFGQMLDELESGGG